MLSSFPRFAEFDRQSGFVEGESRVTMSRIERFKREKKRAFHRALHAFQRENVVPRYIAHPGIPDIDWSCAPPGVDPAHPLVKLNPDRALRKRQQILNFFNPVQLHLGSNKKRHIVVEFCGGSGSLSLFLAWQFPNSNFLILDKKAASLEIAIERIKASGLKNVNTIEMYVQDFKQPFDLGLALHACGEATDLTMDCCLSQRAAFVICPCCVGKVNQGTLVSFPRSQLFRRILCGEVENAKVLHQNGESNINDSLYVDLASAADLAHGNLQTSDDRSRRLCKSYVEFDRASIAGEAGYTSVLYVMSPMTASPKNDVIYGCPASTQFELLPLCDLRWFRDDEEFEF